MSYALGYETRTKIQNELKEIIERNSGGLLDRLDDAKRKAALTRLANAFLNNRLYSEEDIRNVEYWRNKRGVHGPLAQMVINNICNNGNELAIKQKRLEEIDKQIARLMKEKEALLGGMNIDVKKENQTIE